MTSGRLHLRFEDIAMDGRLRLEPLTASLGPVWQDELTRHPLYPWARDQGIIPITTRFVIEGFDAQLAVEGGVQLRGSWEITRTVDATGATQRFLLTISTELDGPLGRTNLPPPDDAGAIKPVGRVVAEHVFTRPFADAAERRVTDLGDFGRTARVVPWAEPRALLELPPGAKALGPREDDAVEHAFGLTHTDSNQHVNSLVYPRLFEEALLRRLGGDAGLARFLDVRYRKPSFVGDRLRLSLQPYELGGKKGAVGAFGDRVFLRMELG